MKAIVLGARPGSGNIGDAVANRLRSHKPNPAFTGEDVWFENWEVETDDCLRGGQYLPPKLSQLADQDACVITLGTTMVQPFWELYDSDIIKVIQGSLILPLLCARCYVEAREPRREYHNVERAFYRNDVMGTIVFIGSYAHRHPFSSGTAYCAAKAGIDMATKTLGWELTGLGYRVHCVHPFHVQGTPMWREVEQGVMETKGLTAEEADDYNRKDLLMPDLLTAEEVAEVVEWLLTNPAAEWTSGTSIELFGGTR